MMENNKTRSELKDRELENVVGGVSFSMANGPIQCPRCLGKGSLAVGRTCPFCGGAGKLNK